MKRTTNKRPTRPVVSPSDLPAQLHFGGSDATLRLLDATDTGRLIQFFGTHTEETIHQRYGYALVQMTPEHARRLVTVDQSRDVALGLFENGRADTVLTAIGRYCLADDGRAAEVAFVVREDRRERGICALLLNTLMNFAAARGVRRLIALVQHDNAAMLAVFRKAGAVITPVAGTSELHVAITTAARTSAVSHA